MIKIENKEKEDKKSAFSEQMRKDLILIIVLFLFPLLTFYSVGAKVIVSRIDYVLTIEI